MMRILVALFLSVLSSSTAAQAEELLWGEIASTLGKGFFNITTSGDLQEYKPYLHHGGPVTLTIERWDVAAGVEYGLLPDLDLHVRLPYFSETLTQSYDGQSIRDSLSGLGEMRVGGRWRFRQWITGRHKDELALLADLKLPTGDSRLRDQNGDLITPHLQPNSGDLGGLLGVAANRHTREGGYWLSAIITGEAASSRYRRGTMLEFHASLGRRLRSLTRADQTDWMGIAGLHYHWMGKDRELGAPLQDSGGSVLSVEIGLVSSKRSRSARLGLLLPVSIHVGRAHAPPLREIQASIRASF